MPWWASRCGLASSDHSAPTRNELMLELLVRAVKLEASGVLSYQLSNRDGSELPAWTPGAHIDLVLNNGLVRQYSLCGDPSDRTTYLIAVLREPKSRGGSQYLHDNQLVGRTLNIRGPRNHFGLEISPSYLFIAGGIGITPIIPMIRAATSAGAMWRLVYGGRTRTSMAFLRAIKAFENAGDIEVVPQDELGLPDLDRSIGAAKDDTLIYCCGPEGLLRAVQERCQNVAAKQLHFERFTSPTSTTREASAILDANRTGDEGFKVELKRSGMILEVPPDRTVLSVIEDVIPEILYSCEEGFCGTCETAVLEGIPDHRDTILTQSERDSNATMMICVSRCKSGRLVLDL